MHEDHEHPPPEVPAETLMREVGAQLRAMRVARGEDVEDIARTLRIRSLYLHSLEEGDVRIMPGRTYALGFLRTYADYLGFDGSDLAGRIAPTIDALIRSVPLRVQPPGREGGLPRLPLVALSLLVVGGIYTGLTWLAENERGEAGPMSSSHELAGLFGRDVDAVVPSANGSSEPLERAVTSADEDPRPTLEDELQGAPAAGPERPSAEVSGAAGPIDGPGPATPEAARQVAAAATDAQPGSSAARRVRADPALDLDRTEPTSSDMALRAGAAVDAVLDAAARSRSSVFEVANRDAQVIIRALERSWVQVTSVRGDYRWSRTLERGDAYFVPNRDDLVLWTGNAGGIEFLVDGEQIAPLGPSGRVMRDVPLEPSALLERAGRPG